MRNFRIGWLCLVGLMALPVGASAQASKAEMVADASQRLADMQAAVDEVTAMRSAARESDADVSRYQCINNVWTTMNGRMRVGETALGQLQTADPADTNQLETAYGLIVVAHTSVMSGVGEANQCGGATQYFSGDDTQRSSESNGGIPTYDVTDTGSTTDPEAREDRDNRLGVRDERFTERTPFNI